MGAETAPGNQYQSRKSWAIIVKLLVLPMWTSPRLNNFSGGSDPGRGHTYKFCLHEYYQVFTVNILEKSLVLLEEGKQLFEIHIPKHSNLIKIYLPEKIFYQSLTNVGEGKYRASVFCNFPYRRKENAQFQLSSSSLSYLRHRELRSTCKVHSPGA